MTNTHTSTQNTQTPCSHCPSAQDLIGSVAPVAPSSIITGYGPQVSKIKLSTATINDAKNSTNPLNLSNATGTAATDLGVKGGNGQGHSPTEYGNGTMTASVPGVPSAADELNTKNSLLEDEKYNEMPELHLRGGAGGLQGKEGGWWYGRCQTSEHDKAHCPKRQDKKKKKEKQDQEALERQKKQEKKDKEAKGSSRVTHKFKK